MGGERCLVPGVNQNVERRPAPVTDPEDIRKRFFRMKMDEDSVREFLNSVGVWSAIEGPHTLDETGTRLLSDNTPVGVPEMRLQGAFGHRWFRGRAQIETVESLQAEQHHWRELRRNRAKLRKAFAVAPPGGATPHRKAAFALESAVRNTLRMHLEWRGKHAHAVVQPITGRELLTALAWIDLITGADCKVCQNPNCGIEYTRGGSKFCSSQCERANTMRTYRAALREKST